MSRILFLLFIPFVPTLLFAQVINIESKRFFKDTNGFVGKIDINYNVNKNVQQVIVFGTSIRTQYRKDRHRLLAIGDLSFVKAGLNDFVNSGYQHLRYNYKILKLVTLESYAQAQYNNVLLLDRRYLAGAGPRFRVLKQKHLRLYAAGTYMYEFQSQNRDSVHQFNHRLSNYISLNFDLGNLDFSSTTYFQPKLTDWSNYRVANETSAIININVHFSFKTGVNLLYDNAQPLGIPAFTYILRNGLSLNF
jgi:hypothetical protein